MYASGDGNTSVTIYSAMHHTYMYHVRLDMSISLSLCRMQISQLLMFVQAHCPRDTMYMQYLCCHSFVMVWCHTSAQLKIPVSPLLSCTLQRNAIYIILFFTNDIYGRKDMLLYPDG